VTDPDATLHNLITRVNVGDMLTRAASRAPGNTALIDGPRRWTWRQLDSDCNRLANSLRGRGYQVGDRLAIMSGNCAEFLMTYYACAKIGVVCVPINLGWRAPEVSYVLKHSGARGIVVSLDWIEAVTSPVAESPGVGEVIVVATRANSADTVAGRRCLSFAELLASGATRNPEVFIEDRAPLQCLYTSGTTSAPKGVIGSHLAVYLESLAIAIEWKFSDKDRIACMMPLFHTAQLNLFCTPAVAVGACMVLLPSFSADRLLSTIEDHEISIIFGLPMMYREMITRDDINAHDLSTVRLAIYGMAPMPDGDLRQAIEIFNCDFSLLFGQTEMSPVTTIFRPEHQLSHTGAVGTPTVNTQVVIMDANGIALNHGESGEIVYRGPQVMNGYLDNPEATATAFKYGWFHSGDVGHFDEDGILWFDDRYKDVIKTGGENVASIEVERALYAADPSIHEVAVIGLPHPRWSEAITAVVVAKPGELVDGEEVRNKAKLNLDGYKVPKSVIVRDDLPKTSTGKIQKAALREHYRDYYQD
jgi:fatty-acyl-CoA synthase